MKVICRWNDGCRKRVLSIEVIIVQELAMFSTKNFRMADFLIFLFLLKLGSDGACLGAGLRLSMSIPFVQVVRSALMEMVK